MDNKSYFELALNAVVKNEDYTKSLTSFLYVTMLAMKSDGDASQDEFECIKYLIKLFKSDISREHVNIEAQKILDNLILM